MPLIERNAADHAAILGALLPQGAVWPGGGTTAIGRVCRGIATSAARLHARAGALLAGAFPATAYDLLPEWELSLGLPDPCAGPAPSLQLRRAQVTAKLTARGGQSVPYFVNVAARLGYSVSIVEYAPARLGAMRLGSRLNDERWAHVWAIRAPTTTVRSFRLGVSGLGERYRDWGNTVLECEMRRLSPAHTTLLFQYS
ncbi:Uncharacterized protein YmfQ in lambdoid prophage, DUF2313 family [Roseomonas rosea]|uniref:Uncharacterized protein YmfQ in lambdoid prophage, DUF2313 family n=1 Tax=Muricoccus roseus TaxID=198092 RepID=A0A1M6LE48_9PROT|nr:putative phage tail protein [Roseomonas rosea]SHJ69438.1 Uncharacterized protein YmfQ in lambdoid prophage, DUF2313 family [Roseomonas rosea]